MAFLSYVMTSVGRRRSFVRSFVVQHKVCGSCVSRKVWPTITTFYKRIYTGPVYNQFDMTSLVSSGRPQNAIKYTAQKSPIIRRNRLTQNHQILRIHSHWIWSRQLLPSFNCLRRRCYCYSIGGLFLFRHTIYLPRCVLWPSGAR